MTALKLAGIIGDLLQLCVRDGATAVMMPLQWLMKEC
jgi:hypothetical protein